MTSTNDRFNSQHSLSSNQQDLLLAALNSNKDNSPANRTINSAAQMNQFSFDGIDPAMFMNGQAPLVNFDTPLLGVDESPYMEFLDGNDPNFDSNFNFDDGIDGEGQMIGGLPSSDDGNDLHDKRKADDEDERDDSENENGAKRQEGEGKVAKKPGRKPLTSEPTSKRKAQNRAAQRAFRERKEQHLKDLETKVLELEKASDSANHENGLLKAQVDRLQIELREYRKRLSMSSGIGRSQPASGFNAMASVANGSQNNNFSFEFPRFGSLPGSVFNGNGTPAKPSAPVHRVSNSSSSSAPGILAREDSIGRSISPRNQARANGSVSSVASPVKSASTSSASGLPTPKSSDSLANSFSPVVLNGLGNTTSLDFNNYVTTTMTSEPQSMSSGSGTNHNSPSRIFQFNSTTTSTSPGSSSSISQYGGANSSCGTSPEPSHNSPSCALNTINEDGTTGAASASNATALGVAATSITNNIDLPNTSSNDLKNFDWLANQNGGQFDPVLFNDYREPQNAIVGDGDFTGGFFNDAMPTMDFSSPFNWADLTAPTGLTPAVQKQNPLEQADALLAGIDEEEVVPGEDTNALLSCHNIWDKLQDRPDFKDGSLDIDGLCSELRAKARCSESGVVIDQKDVDTALKSLPPRHGSSGMSDMGM